MVITEKTENKRVEGFRRGLLQVKLGDYPDVKAELMKALGVNNRNSLANYVNGKTIMRVTQAEAVEGVFNRFGITSNIWGV